MKRNLSLFWCAQEFKLHFQACSHCPCQTPNLNKLSPELHGKPIRKVQQLHREASKGFNYEAFNEKGITNISNYVCKTDSDQLSDEMMVVKLNSLLTEELKALN